MPLVSSLLSEWKPRPGLEEGFNSSPALWIAAPMVRYSKLAFRLLVRKWGCDLTYSPMILADAFVNATKARDSEFTTNSLDRPLIVQFAANQVEPFVAASQLVQDSCGGVNLNCGCPQGWAHKEGIGACLINRPEFIHDLVRQSKNRCREDLDVSIKIRLHADPKRTVEFARQMERAGIDHITVHGRTREQRSDPVNLEAIKEIKLALQIPVIANGDIRSLASAEAMIAATGVDGVMTARGLLENPAFFSESNPEVTPAECISDWLAIAIATGTPFTCFHHHLIYMCEKSLPRAERKVFNTLGSTAAVLDYLGDNYGIAPTKNVMEDLKMCT